MLCWNVEATTLHGDEHGPGRDQHEAALFTIEIDVRTAVGLVGKVAFGHAAAAPLLADKAGQRRCYEKTSGLTHLAHAP